ncbi:MAG: hypothetical protein Fur0018_22550 [Anaerolineales bacterium]
MLNASRGFDECFPGIGYIQPQGGKNILVVVDAMCGGNEGYGIDCAVGHSLCAQHLWREVFVQAGQIVDGFDESLRKELL